MPENPLKTVLKVDPELVEHMSGEALRVAYVLSGIGSVYIGSQGIAELFP